MKYIDLPVIEIRGMLCSVNSSAEHVEQSVRMFRAPMFVMIIILSTFALFVLYAIAVHRRGEDDSLAKFFFRAGIAAFLMGFFGLAFTLVALQSEARLTLSSLFDDPKRTIVISGDGVQSHGTTLTRESVEGLATAINDSRSVLSHHSGPVTLYYIHFVEAGYVFRLSADSANQDEYWLHWTSYPGFEQNYEISQVRQFRSEELTRWNKENVDGVLSDNVEQAHGEPD